MILSLLSILLVITVFITIKSEFDKKKKLIYIFKPLSTIIIIVIAILSMYLSEGYDFGYSLAIIIGLIFCFGGDVALMFQEKRKPFLLGLISFLIGHIVYVVAFTSYSWFVQQDIYSAIVLVILGIGIFVYLYGGLDKMKLPVLFYIIIITLMVNRGISTFFGDFFTTTQAILISAGAILFYISDAILSIAKFKIEFQYNRISLAFYFGGQLLIALSTWGTLF